MDIEVIRNTDKYLIVYKYEGIPFHGSEGRKGVLQIIRSMEADGRIEPGERLFPVHRLDLITSGVMVFARGRKNANLLGNEFRHNRVNKYYIALSDRKPYKKQGTVSGDMIRGRRSGWILTREMKNPAITRFISYPLADQRPGLRFYLLKPRTGRTHQIRVAMKSISAPILGDPLYGRFDLAREEERTYLHACALQFRLGNELVEIQEKPRSGAEFLSSPFLRQWDALGNLFHGGDDPMKGDSQHR